MKHRPSPAKGRRSPAETEAWILGSGTSSLASAFYLVKDAGVPASNVHILDSHGSIGEVVHRLGNSVGEYDQFAGYLPAPVGAPIEELLASIPSTNCRRRSVFDQVQNADMEEALNTEKGSPCYLVQNKQTYRRVSTTLSNLGLKHRLSLLRLMFKLEEHLGGCQIKDVLPPTFFRSPFWAIWSAQFGFQPWHSAMEFRRGVRQYFSDLQTVAILSGHEITERYHHETIFLPIYFYLRSLGVDFRFGTKVSQIVTSPDGCSQTISRLDIIQEGFNIHQDIRPQDIVLATLGSTVSGCAIGTNEYPPALHLMEPTEELDENWSIWLELGSRHAKFGNPYNFCTHRSQSTLVSFTITTEDIAFFQYVSRLSRFSPAAGNFVLLQESQWRINLCIPRQEFGQGQPVDVRILWGYALAPGSKGDFVDKPMLCCSGAEILSEILSHLDYSSELLVRHTVVIPRIMPRMTSFLMSRCFNDRPQVIPPNTTNIGLVGQFVELPHRSCVDLSYGVLAAKIAVFSLMDIDKPCVKSKIPFLTVLRAILWR